MTEEQIREKLVLWVAFNSEIKDFRVKAFAIEICKNFSLERGNAVFKIHDFAERFDIAPGSVRKYTSELIKSGEWLINPIQGKPTAYIPRFII